MRIGVEMKDKEILKTFPRVNLIKILILFIPSIQING